MTRRTHSDHAEVVNHVRIKSLAYQNDANLGFISVGCHFSEIQDGRRQSYFFLVRKQNKYSFRI